MNKSSTQTQPAIPNVNAGVTDIVQPATSSTPETPAAVAGPQPAPEPVAPSISSTHKPVEPVAVGTKKRGPGKSATRRAKDSLRKLVLPDLFEIQRWLGTRIEGHVHRELENKDSQSLPLKPAI